MTLEITNGGGAQTLDIKQPDWQDEGYAVIGDVATPGSGPLAVTIGSGTLGAGNGALSVASGDALVGGATVSNGGVSVDIDSGDSEPRKDVVWIDSTGSVRVDKGTPTGILPQGASGFESYVPPVPFPGTTPATVLAAVFVPANADEIGSGDIQDRRLPADVVRSSLDATSLSTAETVINDASPQQQYPLSLLVGDGTDYQNRAIALQARTDTKPDAGYSPSIDWIAANGDRVGRISGDRNDRHINLYVKSDSFDGSNTTPTAHTRFTYDTNVDAIQMSVGDTGNAGADDGWVDIRTGSNGGGRARLRLIDSGLNPASTLEYRDADNETVLYDNQNGRMALRYYHDRLGRSELDLVQTPVQGLKEYAGPANSDLSPGEFAWDSTNNRWVFKDESGTGHYFTPDGTF